MKKILLIGGKAQNGKDSLADYLKQQLEAKGERVCIMHFAQYIKDILRNYYNWNGEKTEEWRTKLQWLGTERIKEELNYKAFHAKRIAEDIQIISQDFDVILIPDVRFRDEVYTLKAMFPDETLTVKVVRLDFQSKLTEEQKNHKSEIDMDNYNFDKTVYVQTGLQHLYDESDRVLGRILGYKEDIKCKK